MNRRKTWIYDKYVHKKWAAKGKSPAEIFKENREKGIYPDRVYKFYYVLNKFLVIVVVMRSNKTARCRIREKSQKMKITAYLMGLINNHKNRNRNLCRRKKFNQEENQ